jgi:predicted small lipoprotein YifL
MITFEKIIYKMKKVLTSISALCLVALLNACGEKAMDPSAVQAKVDSMAASKIEAASATAISECETRMATEVKYKTDSLVNAAQMANAAL